MTDDLNEAFSRLEYIPMGEFGIPGRRYFKKPGDEKRTHHLHIFQSGSPELERHLAFRDYLIAHPDEARRYSELKAELARRFPEDIEGYMAGKDGYIKEIQRKALAWRRRSP